LKVILDVLPEDSEVGLTSSVDGIFPDKPVLLVVTLDFLLPVRNEFTQDPDVFQLLHQSFVGKTHGINVDANGTFDPSSVRLLHTSPVLKGIGDKGIGRYGGDCLVKIAHFDRCQVDLFHVSVSTVFIHRNPVADADHVIGRQLKTAHKAQNGSAEYEEHNGRQCSDGSQEKSR